MRSAPRHRVFLLAIGLALLAMPLQAQLPTRLSNGEFWDLITRISEPDGQFTSENFTSNETGFQTVIPELLRLVPAGGVYLGVGPEQNFTYIAALRPAMVFIVDIRRQNLQQHLLYKALMELSPHRAAFLERLFSRPMPTSLDSTATTEALFLALERATPDTALRTRTVREVLEHLVRERALPITTADSAGIRHVMEAFLLAGPDLTYSYVVPGTGRGGMGGRGGGMGGRGGGMGGRGRGMPSYATLMRQHDGQGLNRNYLASEASYRVVRELQERNLLVPAVGNFAGPKALRAVADYLRARQATVNVFYLSNVEQYLFPNQGSGWQAFYSNVEQLPLDSTSTFIRSATGRQGWTGTMPITGSGVSLSITSLLAPMQSTVQAFKDGRITIYQDVLARSRTGTPR